MTCPMLLKTRRTGSWLAGCMGPSQTRKWRQNYHKQEGQFSVAPVPRAVIKKRVHVDLHAVCPFIKPKQWRRLRGVFHSSWDTQTVDGGRPVSASKGAPSSPACGDGISGQRPSPGVPVGCWRTGPEPNTAQHLYVAAPRTGRTSHRDCGRFTMRPRGKLRVGCSNISTHATHPYMLNTSVVALWPCYVKTMIASINVSIWGQNIINIRENLSNVLKPPV